MRKLVTLMGGVFVAAQILAISSAAAIPIHVKPSEVFSICGDYRGCFWCDTNPQGPYCQYYACSLYDPKDCWFEVLREGPGGTRAPQWWRDRRYGVAR